MSPGRVLRWLSAGGVALLLAWLLAWPVPIDPVAWEAPTPPGLTGPFEPNERLAAARLIEVAPHEGPEALAAGPDGRVYASTADGRIVRFSPDGSRPETFAETGGRPLGLAFDGRGRLLVANAELGLQRIDVDGRVEALLDAIDDTPLHYANDVAAARDGTIYFSQSTTRFAPQRWGGTYAASLLDIMEHAGTGRVYAYEPEKGTVTLILDGLAFANGIALERPGERFLLVNETGHYRVWRYELTGPETGTATPVIENLPGFPDNLDAGLDGRYWIGLVAPRNALLDALSGRPFLRRVIQRLPAALRPSAVPSSHVIAIDSEGRVTADLQDPAARLPAITGVLETGEALYLSSLFGHRLGRLAVTPAGL